MTAAIPVIVERDNVNDETVVLTRWFVSSGERVEIDQLIAEIETSKATVEVHSPGAGFIRYTTKEGGEIAVGQVLCFSSITTLKISQLEGKGYKARTVPKLIAWTIRYLKGITQTHTALVTRAQKVSTRMFPQTARKLGLAAARRSCWQRNEISDQRCLLREC